MANDNQQFSITSEYDYKTELDNELNLFIFNVRTSKGKLKNFSDSRIRRTEESKMENKQSSDMITSWIKEVKIKV